MLDRPSLGLSCAIAFAIGACSSSSSTTAPAGDAGVPDAASHEAASAGDARPAGADGGTDAGGLPDLPDAGGTCAPGGNLCDAGVACTSTPNGACTVTTMAGSGNVPAFTGGALVDGTYHLTTAISYGSTGAVGQKQRVTIAITSGSFSLVQDSDASCNSAPSGKGTYATAGNQWTLTFACPAAGSQTTAYTATPTGFSIGDSTQPSGVVFNYTRQ